MGLPVRWISELAAAPGLERTHSSSADTVRLGILPLVSQDQSRNLDFLRASAVLFVLVAHLLAFHNHLTAFGHHLGLVWSPAVLHSYELGIASVSPSAERKDWRRAPFLPLHHPSCVSHLPRERRRCSPGVDVPVSRSIRAPWILLSFTNDDFRARHQSLVGPEHRAERIDSRNALESSLRDEHVSVTAGPVRLGGKTENVEASGVANSCNILQPNMLL